LETDIMIAFKPALRAALVGALALLASACGTARNTVEDGADKALMLRGHDPAAYFTQKAAVKGNPAIKADHEGLTYRFVSEEHKRMFVASPARFVPAYGGACSNGAPYAVKTHGTTGAIFEVYKDRLYVFGGRDSRKHWLMEPDKNIQLADGYWESEMKDTPHKLQNLKRIFLFRVPHYKTDAELEAEWRRRNPGQTSALPGAEDRRPG
jgi:YHS domain-containing protein